MEKIQFWKDREKRVIDPILFSKKAEDLAKTLAEENTIKKSINRRSQIRKFYDEVLRLNELARKAQDQKDWREQWENLIPYVHMLVAKAAYAKGRDLVSDDFLNFIRDSIDQIKSPEDLQVFTDFFEAFMGFYRHHCKTN